MKRRTFLAAGAASIPAALWAQRPAATAAPGAPLPPPPAAKITSSVMLWTLKGGFEERVLTAAKAGIQSVELLNEYAEWDDAAMAKARKFIASFGMAIDAIAALPGGTLDRTIAAARK